MTESNGTMALAGVRVLGVTNWASGAFAEQLLADMGAEVVRVEKPGTGDDARQVSPRYRGESTTFLFPNRNKKSITINLKTSAGAEMVRKMIPQFDVLLENNRPGTLEKFGLGYQTLQELHPKLVMTSISGYGQTGPYRDRPAYDMSMQALTGLMSLTGNEDGPPLRAGVAVCDYLAGLNAAYATLVALIHCRNTGEGQHVDVSLYESAIAVLGTALQDYLLLGTVRKRAGNRFGSMMPSNTYACLDGYIQLTANNDLQWKRLSPFLGLNSPDGDPRFATAATRLANRDVLDDLVARCVAGQRRVDLAEALSNAGVPCAPVNSIEDLVADPHFKHRNIAVPIAHPTAGMMDMVAPMPRLSRTPGTVRSAPPLLGAHNEEIFASMLGFDASDLARLREDGVI